MATKVPQCLLVCESSNSSEDEDDSSEELESLGLESLGLESDDDSDSTTD